jgi:RNA polymerase sigma-70 factor, ECF subfamily
MVRMSSDLNAAGLALHLLCRITPFLLNQPTARMPDSAQESTSLSLIRRVQVGDVDAWAHFVRVYGPQVYDWCRRFGLQASDASDVMQEVFRTVNSSITGYQKQDSGGGFRGWLWTVTRSRFLDHIRNQQKRLQASGGTDAQHQLLDLPAEPPAVDDEPTSHDLSLLKRRALEIIREESDKRNWQSFWRSAVEGEEPRHIAADLGITVSAVHKARQRILRRLREELGDLLE